MRLLLSCVFLVSVCHAQQSVPPVGEWREHLPYNSAIDVSAGNNKVFAATPYSILSLDLKDNTVERLSRITGLSETGISHIAFDEPNNKLVIAYANSNIDIINGHDIYNIPDIKRSAITGDKNIYGIYIRGSNYYLSSGLGIIVLDATRNEVRETWMIGNGGNPVKVNAVSSDANYFYAATEEGLKKAAVNAPDLSDPSNWVTALVNGSTSRMTNVFNLNGTVFVQKNDSIFVQGGGGWNFFYADGWRIINTNSSENRILVSERQSSGLSRIVQLKPDGSVSRIIANSGAVSYPQKALLYKNETWVADLYESLSAFGTSDNYRSYKLNSPQSVASGELTVFNNIFFAAAGSVNDSWNYQYNGDGIYILDRGQWTNINRYRFSQLDSLLDFMTIAVDKKDETVWAGSFGGGLLHIKPGPVFEIFKQNYLGVTVGDPGSYRVAGLVFDRDNNLWISNYGSAQQLKVRKQDGSWKAFTVPGNLYDNALAQILVDDNNYKWIVAPQGNGLIVFDHGNSIDNTGDDRWKRLAAGSGNGNLPANEVLCIEKDRNGFIWVGTTDGIAVIECPQDIFTARGCEAILPVVPNGNFAGYLFKGQEIRSIITDGANRKWVATKAGVFLVSADGQQVIYHFTEDNSPLLSNDVKKITINGKSGEVFFATQKGICSFRSTATEGGVKHEELLVFPNPVPAGYGGTIAISGLAANSIVKITELDGRLVYQTRANGGQATWDGKNYRGKKISSGAYLILVKSDDGKENISGKIFFIGE